MVEHTKVSRKTTNEDRIAICPQLGCETIKRVKPLKLGFLGFGKYPTCRKHHLPLVYVDERIGEVVDASLACLFDKSGLPPKALLTTIKEKFPKEFSTFINSWVYCITIGRGAKIISAYMNTITNSYLKQITKKQLKDLKNDTSIICKTIARGIDEITLQFERLLKHLRVHSEVFINIQKILNPSAGLRNVLNRWLEVSSKEKTILLKIEEKQFIPISQVKGYYDRILNIGTCRCLLGLPPIEKNNKKNNISAFDRFSAYFEFWLDNLTQKFTISDIEDLYNTTKVCIVSPNSFTNDELEFLKRKKIVTSKLKTRWAWVINKQIAMEFYNEVILPKFENVPKAHDMDNLGYRGFRASIRKLGLGVNDLTKAAGFKPYHEEKYTGMNYDELLKFFKENVYPEVKSKLKLKTGEAPGAGDLERKGLGYRGFVDRVRKVSKLEGIARNIWAEFVKKAGLEPQKDLIYQGMDFVELMDLFVKEIYPYLKEKYNIGHKQAPLKEQVDKEYNGFRKAIRRLGYKLSDLYIALDFKHKFWQIYHNKSYKELLNFFKDIIQPSLQDIYDFSETEAPSYEEVEINYRGFIQALNRHGKKLSDVIKNLGYIPRKFSNLGVITHSVMNLLLSYYINNKNFPLNYYSEVELYSSSKHRIDGFMFVTTPLISFFNKQIKKLYSNINNKKEREEILLLLRKIEGKQHLLIDFSNGFFKRRKINSELIAQKAKKYLDYPNSFLILIGTNWSNLELIKRLPISVKYKNSNYVTKNVALISPELFGILLGINNMYKDFLDKIILYNKNEDIDKLQEVHKALERIKDIHYFSTDEFNKIKDTNTLLKWL
ncbi:MAG: hypothetical protein KGD72_04230 [Candidatus Lokiarchaeota archaeon]|nr:hypothetical protein [Candidatus Lokiarchaeota archaeon]